MASRVDPPKKVEELKEVALPKWQNDLINSIFNSIKNNYIFPGKIDEVAFKKLLIENFIRINTEFPLADKKKFCDEVNNVLKIIDPHLILQYDPDQIADHKKHKRVIDDPRGNGCARFVGLDLDVPQSWYEKFAKENYGFGEKAVSRRSPDRRALIPKAIGYVKINDFLDPRNGLGRLAEAKAHEILKNMQGKKALIIDLRNSHGGSPEMVEFIMSYLLSEMDKTKIKDGVYNNIFDSSTGLTQEYKVRPTEFCLNIPIIVLTNENTFSAAEELAYDLQQLNRHALKDNRFVIVGQTTKGGSHPMASFPLMDADSREINRDYFLWVPTRTAVNPYTHTNWEDGPQEEKEKPGVRPDAGFEIPKGQNALKVAVAHLISTPALAHEEKATPTFSTTAHAATVLGIPPSGLTPAPALADKEKEDKVEVSAKRPSPTRKDKSVDITDEEMLKHAFGQGSDTYKKMRP